MARVQRVRPFLWFDGNAREAAEFYTSIFPNSSIESSSPMSATFQIDGVQFVAFNGGPAYEFTPAISFFVECENQDEVDYFWDKLLADGGEPSRCGWLTDQFGLSWQIVPDVLGDLINGDDEDGAARAMQAMLGMAKLDIAALRAAYDGTVTGK
jgi:predicted 3-demethylubiquinone-9 3-methyltransferase (glyoxalase superfamily)